MKFYDSLAVHGALLRNRTQGENATRRDSRGMRTAAASRLTVPLFLLVPPLFRERARSMLHVADRHAAPIDTHLINRVNNPARVIGNWRLFFLFSICFFFFSHEGKAIRVRSLLLRANERSRLFNDECSFSIHGMIAERSRERVESSRVESSRVEFSHEIIESSSFPFFMLFTASASAAPVHRTLRSLALRARLRYFFSVNALSYK